HISKGSIAYPFFLTIQHPPPLCQTRRRGESARGARTYLRLGQPESAYFCKLLKLRQPFILLFFRSAKIDRAHNQSALHSKKGCNGRINPRHLHGNYPFHQEGKIRASISFVSNATQIQRCKLGKYFKGKLVA